MCWILENLLLHISIVYWCIEPVWNYDTHNWQFLCLNQVNHFFMLPNLHVYVFVATLTHYWSFYLYCGIKNIFWKEDEETSITINTSSPSIFTYPQSILCQSATARHVRVSRSFYMKTISSFHIPWCRCTATTVLVGQGSSIVVGRKGRKIPEIALHENVKQVANEILLERGGDITDFGKRDVRFWRLYLFGADCGLKLGIRGIY